MAIERDDLKEILAAVAAAGFDDFSLEIGDVKIHLTKRNGAATGSPSDGTVVATVHPAGAPASQPAPADSGTTAGVAPSASHPMGAPARRPASAPEALDGLAAVTAPLLGTFYRAPAPDAAPFVEVGSMVEPDDTVCIIEVMKLMNNVRAGRRGRVVRICADNAALVEFGQTLVLIEPLP